MNGGVWIACQLGARDHYAVPRALQEFGKLCLLVTDAWTRRGNPIGLLPGAQARRLTERYHPDLDPADVEDFSLSLVRQEVDWRLQGLKDWDLTIARNEWFQQEAAMAIARAQVPASKPITVFAYAYAARAIFRAAKARGWRTVLGQIDAGEEHFTIVRRLSYESPQYGPAPAAPPIAYFESWREECALADRIVVNSVWSRDAIVRAGIDAGKIFVVPLAYEPSVTNEPERVFPVRFTPERPLRLLYAGALAVSKGVPELLDAMALLRGLPVTLQLVGPTAMRIPDSVQALTAVSMPGAVVRGEMEQFYQANDLLVFPSHSDGFGIVQAEAQAHGLPVIASTHCGRVVEPGVTGELLPDVSATAIANVILQLVEHPQRLAQWSRNARLARQSTLRSMGEALLKASAF